LPAIAAVGGAVVPVGLYLGYLHLFADGVGQGGWAIPMATDIAFVVGCLALLGSRIPTSLKIFMLSLAIIDDILAVGIIAVFFSTTIKVGWLFSALGGLGLTVFLNRIGVRRIGVYIFVGSFIWLCTLKSGVHPTIAGVALGLLTPASAWIGNESLLGIIEAAVSKLRQANEGPDGDRRAAAQDLATAATESVSPLERLEESLHPWVSFMIMSVFALANAGVTVEGANATEPVTMATSIGLVLGKPLGIVGASWLAVRLRVATLPEGTGWPALVGAACLGGIGFTMALFISSLSMSGPSLAAAKLGILIGSGASLCIGMTVLAITLRPTAPATGNE
ncbi:MAG: Na+/H+ antiporter NhaA, partial [Myxococcales bacterium]|nr:Na+/H+ antiporter NhaA [Myxococcales bacterium]